jgi:hypothetical protein
MQRNNNQGMFTNLLGPMSVDPREADARALQAFQQNALAQARLTPLQQVSYMSQTAGHQLGTALGRMMGGRTQEEAQAQEAQRIYQQAYVEGDPVQSHINLANHFDRVGQPEKAFQARQQAALLAQQQQEMQTRQTEQEFEQLRGDVYGNVGDPSLLTPEQLQVMELATTPPAQRQALIQQQAQQRQEQQRQSNVNSLIETHYPDMDPKLKEIAMQDPSVAKALLTGAVQNTVAAKKQAVQRATAASQQGGTSGGSGGVSRSVNRAGTRAPAGYQWTEDEMGVEPIPGGPKDTSQPAGSVSGSNDRKPMSEGQAKAFNFASRMDIAHRQLLELEEEALAGSNVIDPLIQSLGTMNNMFGTAVSGLSGEANQRNMQARRDFINAVLRRESGAVIADSEFANAERQYFPQPGDSPETIRQKQRNRLVALEGIGVDIPEAYKEDFNSLVEANSPASQASDNKDSPTTQRGTAEAAFNTGSIVVVDGKKYRFIGGDKTNRDNYREVRTRSNSNTIRLSTAPWSVRSAQPAQRPAQAAMPQAGEVRDGYRFLGGNPADRNSWVEVK